MAALRPSVPALILAGRGELPGALTRMIAELGLDERVRIYPDVPDAELPALYRGASVYLQASHEEGLGISVIEAMACGLPVVGTETAGTRETIVDGETGWLINQTGDVEGAIVERIFSVLDNEAREMPFRARSRAVSLFSSQTTLGRFFQIYEQLRDGVPARH